METRTEWIGLQKDLGNDFVALLEAMSKLRFEIKEGELIVDASAIANDPYLPSGCALFPDTEVEGHWIAEGPSESAPLVEHLISFVHLHVKESMRLPLPTESPR